MRQTSCKIRILTVLVWLLGIAGCSSQSGPEIEEQAELMADQRVIEHTVGPGESLSLIADNYYGDPNRGSDIVAQNGLSDPDLLVPGSVLRLQFSEDEWEAALKRASALKSYNKGVDLMADERVGEAEKQFKMALETAPDLLAAKYNLALAHLKRGRNDRALVLLAELTETRPENPDFLFARGNALFQGTQFTAAADQFSQALHYRPGFKRAAFGLARSYQEDGQTDRAIAAWQAYLQLDSTSSWATTAQRNLNILLEGPDETER
ncbi:MAG: tetratricopeptide (TPR) repeat protein [Candidatus Krumholzibacteriia bacterium]|jgi:tetratricopeptide (TPR) repeat protein